MAEYGVAHLSSSEAWDNRLRSYCVPWLPQILLWEPDWRQTPKYTPASVT
ncbi:hypothetical protein ACRRTK_008764 [Alexandromys fortis]